MTGAGASAGASAGPSAGAPCGAPVGADVAAAAGSNIAEVRLGPVHEIPLGSARAYAVDGDVVAVFRLRDGQVRAVSGVCPHAGGPLADGLADRDVVICPLHQHTFELATGCSTTGQPPLTVYPIRIDADDHLVIARPPVRSRA